MAPARQVNRDAALPARRHFDEQLWPVYLALLLLGCVLMGVSAVYQPLAGVPWYATAWPSLIGVPILIVACMVALAKIDSRRFHRSVQFSLVLAAILHVGLFVQMLETSIFGGRIAHQRQREKIVERRPLLIVPEYHRTQLLPEEDRPRQDFEKPVETRTPEPTRELEKFVRRPDEQDSSPPEAQPVPVPEPQRTPQPNIVSRQRMNEALPRLAAQSSRLSRQLKSSESRTSQVVEAPQASAQSKRTIEAQPAASPLARQQAEPVVSDRPATEPTTTQVVVRSPDRVTPRADQPNPSESSSSAPKLPRIVATPAAMPPAVVAAAESPPAASRRTSPDAIRPATTASTGRAVATAQPQRPSVETPEINTQLPLRHQRREAPGPLDPQIAAVSVPIPNRQPRASAPPDLTTAAAAGAGAGGEQIALPAAAASSGQPDGAPLEASGSLTSRLAGGPSGPATVRPASAEVPEVSDVSNVASAPGRRPSSAETEHVPLTEDIPSAAAIGRHSAFTAATGGSTTVAEIPEVGPMSAVAQAEHDHLIGGAGRTVMTRQTASALAVEIDAPSGAGGLGTDYTPDVGINTRQASAESVSVQFRSARFARSEVGGLPAVSTAAVLPAEAFSSRGARLRGQTPAGGRGTPAPQTEEAIERGLAFLARHQAPNGGWSLQGFPEEAQLVSDSAATALALIAFQGAGYTHREFQYQDNVRRGLEYLLTGQQASGDLFVPLHDASNQTVWLYSHSLAAIALCEAYGMTQDPALRQPAQRAIDFIVASQHPRLGGWRYAPGVGSDTSVSGWMMMALKSGELAGLDVSGDAYARIDRWLADAQQSSGEPHMYRYNPQAPDTPQQRHGRSASKTMTAVGLLMRLYGGWRRDNANMVRGAQFLADNLPASGTFRDPQRDTYYWYYATQVMSHMGGDYWQAWSGRLHPLLVNSQVRDGPLAGSWDPARPVADRWGPHAGRLYVTTMNLLSLEVQYRKLPLYEDLRQE